MIFIIKIQWKYIVQKQQCMISECKGQSHFSQSNTSQKISLNVDADHY